MPKFTYSDIKICQEFRSHFSAMYNAHRHSFVDTPYEKVYNALGDFEYTVTRGLLDDPRGPEYLRGRTALQSMYHAIQSVLGSNYTFTPQYAHIQGEMLSVASILNDLWRNQHKKISISL